MITGFVKSEKFCPEYVEVFWTIEKLYNKLKRDDVLLSVPFYFAGQMWRLLLGFARLHLSLTFFSISRITVSTDETPDFPVVGWNMGIIGSMRAFHYGHTGFARLEKVFEWMTVARFPGPALEYLRLQKDLYMPDDKITIALRLTLHSRDELIKNETDPIENIINLSIISDFTIINVKDKTFYAEDSILELDGISKDRELKISEWSGVRMTTIDLPECDPEAFEFFLSFKYSRGVESVTDDMAEEVYDIADKFQDTELKRQCVHRFLTNLKVSSTCRFLEIAERYQDQALKEKCTEFFLKNAREILNTSEWLEFMATRTKFANDLFISYLDSKAR